MAAIEKAKRLVRAGCFSEALAELDAANVIGSQRPTVLALRADLLASVGRLDEARTLAQTLLRGQRSLSASERSACECVLGRIARETVNSQVAIDHLQRAVSS